MHIRNIFSAMLVLSATSAVAVEFGEKSVSQFIKVEDSLSIRMVCSAAKDDGLSDEVEGVANTASNALPGYAQYFVMKGLRDAMIVSPGEAYCAVVVTKEKADISGGSVYTTAVQNGQLAATETDSIACQLLNKTGICWEEVSSGSSELDGVIGCFDANYAGESFSVVTAREEVLKVAGISETGLSKSSCDERGLAMR